MILLFSLMTRINHQWLIISHAQQTERERELILYRYSAKDIRTNQNRLRCNETSDFSFFEEFDQIIYNHRWDFRRFMSNIWWFKSSYECNVLKTYRRLKQIESFKDFNIFWTEFQKLVSDLELYNQNALLENLKNKISYELQKVLAIESYKVTDLHEFAKMCRYINQTLRNLDNKFRNKREKFANSVKREKVTVIVNSN